MKREKELDALDQTKESRQVQQGQGWVSAVYIEETP